jgi:hypothetical protein
VLVVVCCIFFPRPFLLQVFGQVQISCIFGKLHFN